MRSVRYRLFGFPKNQSDCVNYAKDNKIVRIIVVPMWEDEMREDDIVTAIYATYIWVFESKATTYDIILTKLFSSEDEEQQKACMDNANRRMMFTTKDLATRLGVIVEGGKSHFLFKKANSVEVKWVAD